MKRKQASKESEHESEDKRLKTSSEDLFGRSEETSFYIRSPISIAETTELFHKNIGWARICLYVL